MCDYEEITVTLGKVGRLLLFAFRIRENSEDENTELKQIRPCNYHVRHPLSLGAQKKCVTPRKNQGEPPAGVLVAPRTG